MSLAVLATIWANSWVWSSPPGGGFEAPVRLAGCAMSCDFNMTLVRLFVSWDFDVKFVFFCVLGSTRYISSDKLLCVKIPPGGYQCCCKSYPLVSSLHLVAEWVYQPYLQDVIILAKYPVLSSVTVKLHINPILHTALILSLSLLTILLYSIALSPKLPYDCGESLRIGPLDISMQWVILNRVFYIEQVGILCVICLTSWYSVHNLFNKLVFCAKLV